MTGKERILAVLAGQPTDKTPWVPFAGVHAGKLKGYNAKEVSQDADKLFESLLEANKLYKPDGQPVMFDLQIEAEILGCGLLWAEDAPPTVSSHPLEQDNTIPSHIPLPDEGRLSLELEVMKRMKSAVGDSTALYGLLCGPFTLASHLRGTNFFMDMMMDEEYVHNLLEYTTNVAIAISDYFIDAGIDVVAAVDPLISQISPDHFKQYMHKPFSRFFSHITQRNAHSSFFVCGNAKMNIGPMCETGPDNISIDENIDLGFAKSITDSYGITIGGNIPLTSVMLFGNQQDNMKTVVELIDSVDSSKNLIIAPGCDMPYDIPVENTIAIEQAVHQTEEVRKMVENYEGADLVFEGELPDYGNLERPLVEVFTLDSATCAACTYMLASAMDAKKSISEAIDVVEYKYTSPENIARCKEMGVKQLPSIYINGELKYSSIIPNRDELISEIRKVL